MNVEVGLAQAGLAQRIADLIRAREPEASTVEVGELTRLSGGNARQAWSFVANWNGGLGPRSKQCVMLCKAGAGQLEADIGREYRILAALQQSDVPSPRVLWLDETGDHLGMPGFVMEQGVGEASILPLLRPDSTMTRPLTEQLLRVAADLHQVDWKKEGLGFLAEGDPAQAPARELERWRNQFLQNRLEPLPILASVFEWLRLNIPASSRVSIVHGDLRLGNFLYRGDRIELLLDWEMAHLGDPLEDIAWVYRALWSPAAFLPLDEAAAVYGNAIGRSPPPRDLLYYRIFSEAKFAVISLTAARNYADGRTENLRMAGRMFRVPECLALCLRWIDQWEDA